MKFYPQGAIQTKDELLSYWLCPVWRVEALGTQSDMRMILVLGRETDCPLDDEEAQFLAVWAANEHQPEGGIATSVSLRDNNIGGGGYNFHFLFGCENDAWAYMAWAKKNTLDMREDTW